MKRMNFFAGFFFVPLFYPLGLTSIYEYLELRYGSKAVRLFAVVILVRSICVWMLGEREQISGF